MEELGVIGNGSFGLIKKVRRVADGKILARKEIDYKKMSEKEKRQLVSEVNILRELKHPNIVRYYERQVDKSNSMIFIIMEYCEGGDLSHVIKRCRKEDKHLPEQIVVNILSQLVLALYECHHGSGKKNHATILHRDIKPENVFIDSDSNIKLGDFGLSKVLMSDNETEFAKTYVGTPFYMSPELVNDSMYNIKSDIWALGCLIYEICALEPPFQSKTQQGLSSKIRQGKVDPLPSYYSNDLNRIVRAMLNVDQTKRPLTKDLIRIPKVQLYIRESEIEKVEIELKRKEQELNFRESAILRKEIQLNVRHETLNAKESELNERESRFMRKPLESLNRTLSCTPTKYKNQAMPMSDVKARLTPIDIHKHRGNGGFSIKKLEKEMHEMMISP